MISSRGGTILVSAFFIGSTIFVGFQNYQLRSRLKEDRSIIATLQAGTLHEGATAPSVKQPVTLIRLSSSHGNEPQSRDRSALPSADPNCAKCRENSPDVLPGSIPGISLLELKQHYVGGSDSDFTLFIFFSPTDCPACLREAKIWQDLFRDREMLHLSVVGIVDQCNQREAEVFAEQLGTAFPVMFDAQSTLRSSFGISRTPEKILIDKEGHVLLTDSGNKTEETQTAFNQEIRKKCKRPKT